MRAFAWCGTNQPTSSARAPLPLERCAGRAQNDPRTLPPQYVGVLHVLARLVLLVCSAALRRRPAQTLERSGMRADDVRWFVPHQANGRIISSAAQRLGIGDDRVISNLDRYGNTSSASIPLALFEAVDEGRVRDGDLILMSGFGAGMTWASALLRWDLPRGTRRVSAPPGSARHGRFEGHRRGDVPRARVGGRRRRRRLHERRGRRERNRRRDRARRRSPRSRSDRRRPTLRPSTPRARPIEGELGPITIAVNNGAITATVS